VVGISRDGLTARALGLSTSAGAPGRIGAMLLAVGWAGAVLTLWLLWPR
jgi:hypothetical protein